MGGTLATCCCGDVCYYVATRCECASVEAPEQLFVRCSSVDPFGTEGSIVFRDPDVGACYEIDLTQEPIVGSKPLGPFGTIDKVFDSCADCCDPCGPCTDQFGDFICDCTTPTSFLLEIANQRVYAEVDFGTGVGGDFLAWGCASSTVTAEWQVTASTVIQKQGDSCVWNNAGQTFSVTWKLVAITGCVVDEEPWWTVNHECTCTHLVTLPDECNPFAAEVSCQTLFDGKFSPIGRRWVMTYGGPLILTTGAAATTCQAVVEWANLFNHSIPTSFTSTNVPTLCSWVLGAFGVPRPTAFGPGTCFGAKMFGRIGPLAVGDCCLEDTAWNAVDRLPADGSFAEIVLPSSGAIARRRIEIIDHGTVTLT